MAQMEIIMNDYKFNVDLEELVELYGDDLLVMNGYDDAIVGVVERCGQAPFILYDSKKVIDINVQMGMSLEEAQEYFDYNQHGAWVGDSTPGFIYFNDV